MFLMCLSGCGSVWKGTNQNKYAFPLSKEDAMKMSDDYVQQKGLPWTKVSRVGLIGSKYHIGYETPPDELRLRGNRLIIIDINSGNVEIFPKL